MRSRSWSFGLILLLLCVPAFALSTKSLEDGLTPHEIAAFLTGPGATISNVKIIGSEIAIGTFSDAAALGIGAGVILSTGNIAEAAGPNKGSGSGAALGTPGHYTLDPIVAPFTTHDAVVLEFDVVTESPTFAIRYVFASEEYREYVGSQFNDVFAFFVNGTNIALAPGTIEPVTVNTINHSQNRGAYRDNETGDGTEFDGYTVPLTAVAVVEPGVVHRIRIAIADTSDQILDSAVFIAQGGISGSFIAPVIIPEVAAVTARNGESVDVPIAVYYASETVPPVFSASGLAEADVKFSPLFTVPDGRRMTTMTITPGPLTPPGSHVVSIRSAAGGSESFATIIVVVDCKPPSLLGVGQPQTVVVDRGRAATFRIEPQGSTPQRYQWFVGHTGMTFNPVPGANGPQLTTGPITEPTLYWVRITNPCGSFDSVPAMAIPR